MNEANLEQIKYCHGCGRPTMRGECVAAEHLCSSPALALLDSIGMHCTTRVTTMETNEIRVQQETNEQEQTTTAALRRAAFAVSGLACAVCSQSMECAIRKKFAGIVDVFISPNTNEVTVTWQGLSISVDRQRVVPSSKAQSKSTNRDEHKSKSFSATNGSNIPSAKSVATPNAIRDFIQSLGYLVEQDLLVEEELSNHSSIFNHRDDDNALRTREFWKRVCLQQTARLSTCRRDFTLSVGVKFAIMIILAGNYIIPPYYAALLSHRVHIFHHAWQLQTLAIWLLSTFVQFVLGFQFCSRAFARLKSGQAGVDLLVALSSGASYGYAIAAILWNMDKVASQFSVNVVVIINMTLLGKLLQARTERPICTDTTTTKLLQLETRTAIKVVPISPTLNGSKESIFSAGFNPMHVPYQEEIIPVEQLQVGDVVKVIGGATIPIDGRVLLGTILVNESGIKENASRHALKTTGSFVLSGTKCIRMTNANNAGLFVKEKSPKTTSSEESVFLGAAFVQVTGTGSSTALEKTAQIIQLAQINRLGSALQQRSFVDKIAAVFVSIVCFLAILTFTTWYTLARIYINMPRDWFMDGPNEHPIAFGLLFAMAYLVISYPCALGLAAPMAVMTGSAVGSKKGLLMKGGQEVWEMSAKVDVVVLEKEGLVTEGKHVVTDFELLQTPCNDAAPFSENGMNEDSLFQNTLWLLASLQSSLEFPLARAIVDYAKANLSKSYLQANPFGRVFDLYALDGHGFSGVVDNKVKIVIGNRLFARFKNLPFSSRVEDNMKRLERQGKTALIAAVEGHVCAVLGLSDKLKHGTPAYIAYLRDAMGVDVFLMTGGNRYVANAIADKLSLSTNHVISATNSADKVEFVRKLQSGGRRVAMVAGDLKNIPCLIQADVGICVGANSDMVAEASDIVLVAGAVRDVINALHLSRKVYRRIKLNCIWALLFNCLGMPLAAGLFHPKIHGGCSPALTVIAMALSFICVVLSSTLLQLYRVPDILEQVPTSSSTRSIPAFRKHERLIDNGDLTLDLLSNDYQIPTADIESGATLSRQNSF